MGNLLSWMFGIGGKGISQITSDDLLIQTRLFPVDISRLTSFQDYLIAY